MDKLNWFERLMVFTFMLGVFGLISNGFLDQLKFGLLFWLSFGVLVTSLYLGLRFNSDFDKKEEMGWEYHEN